MKILKNNNRRHLILVGILAILGACAGGVRDVPAGSCPIPIDGASEYRIGPGNVLNIFVWRNDELSMVLPVRPDGRITIPLVDDATEIVRLYAGMLQELADGEVRTYRAGGFCIEPFAQIRSELKKQGIMIDSSVVPGAVLKDEGKGFDFGQVPDSSWWRFDDSPLNRAADGEFLEIAITPVTLPMFHYWGRAFDRLLGRRAADITGDGLSKAIGRRKIVRRLAGLGRVSELSIDAPKAGQLAAPHVARQNRDVWQVIGHPKLLGRSSLQALESFIERQQIQRFETLSGLASAK